MLELEFKDEFFKFRGITHVREISRAFVLDEENRIAIHLIKRHDPLDRFRYYESPGGGIDDGETKEEAVIREIKEELGYNSEIIKEIAYVKDYYNILKRENHQHYFLLRRKEFVGKHLVSFGDSMIKETIWVSVDEAIKLYKSLAKGRIGKIVARREIPVLEELKKEGL